MSTYRGGLCIGLVDQAWAADVSLLLPVRIENGRDEGADIYNCRENSEGDLFQLQPSALHGFIEYQLLCFTTS